MKVDANDHEKQLEILRGATAVLTLETVKQVPAALKQAHAASLYLVAKGADKEARKVDTWRLTLQRRAGQLLAEMPKQSPGEHWQEKRLHDATVTPTYASLGIEKADAHRWQTIARIPEEKFAEFLSVADEITTAGAMRIGREAARFAGVETPPLPSGKYRILYADPPWEYGNAQHGKEEQETVLKTHYPTMPDDMLMALPVSTIAEEEAVLFLWATSPRIKIALALIESWGFEYKAMFVWDKVKHNVGYYNSVRHELLLICTRGSCLPDVKELHDSVVSIERTEHSVKPAYFRDLIDKMYPNGKRVELFAREASPGWDKWGNESS